MLVLGGRALSSPPPRRLPTRAGPPLTHHTQPFPTLPACFRCQGDGGMLTQTCFVLCRYQVPGFGYFSKCIYFLKFTGSLRHFPMGWSCSGLPAHPSPRAASHLSCPVCWWGYKAGERRRCLIPSSPATSSCSRPFCNQGTEEFWGVLLVSSRSTTGLAGTGGTDLHWDLGAESGWMGTVLTSTGTLSSANTPILGLCSKQGPWNTCIKNKHTHTKHIPTVQEE